MTYFSIPSLPRLRVPDLELYWSECNQFSESKELLAVSGLLGRCKSSFSKRTQNKKSKRCSPTASLRFVLTSADQLAAAAEVDIYGGKVKKASLSVQACSASLDQALPTLVCALIIQYDLDSLLIAEPDDALLPNLEPKTHVDMLVLTRDGQSYRSQRQIGWRIEASAWLQANQHSAHVRQLRFLQIRKIRRRRQEAQPTRKRAFLSRLFRPKIEDSFF